LFPRLNFPITFVPTQHGFRSLFPIAFQARLPVYALKRAHVQTINLRRAKSFPTRLISINCRFSRSLLHQIEGA